MPDLFAHFTSGFLPSRHRCLRDHDALFVIGAILPDVLTRIPNIVLGQFLTAPIAPFFDALHTPIALLLVCYLCTFAFEELKRKAIFISVLAGAQLHFVLDVMQRQFFYPVYMPYFPFSTKKFQLGLFYFDDSIYLFPLFLGLTLWVWIRTRGERSTH